VEEVEKPRKKKNIKSQSYTKNPLRGGKKRKKNFSVRFRGGKKRVFQPSHHPPVRNPIESTG
jgi:hypothetical protein